MSNRINATQKTAVITATAMMTALATVIYMFFPEIPLVPGVEYLKIDFSDIPAIVLSVVAGPLPGFLVEVIKNIIHLMKSTTLGVGELINIGVGAAMIYGLYAFRRLMAHFTRKNMLHPAVYLPAAVLSVGVVVAAGWLLNLVLTPLYFSIMGIPMSAGLIWGGVIGSTALNAVKAALNLLPFYPVIYAVDRAVGHLFR